MYLETVSVGCCVCDWWLSWLLCVRLVSQLAVVCATGGSVGCCVCDWWLSWLLCVRLVAQLAVVCATGGSVGCCVCDWCLSWLLRLIELLHELVYVCDLLSPL